MSDDSLKKIIPAFVAIVNKALETGKFTCFRIIDRESLIYSFVEFPGGSLELCKVTAEQETKETAQTGHYFTFCLPYAGVNVEWEILFDPLHPSCPPDFVCSEDIECDPNTYTRIVEDWDFKSVDCLAKLIKDLSGLYQEYQVGDCSVFSSRLYFLSDFHLV